LHRYVPDYVRSLDRQAQQYGLKYGIAGYWHARLITLLSTTGLRVYPVDGSLNPFLIVSNAQWYLQSIEDRAQHPCFSFVVLNDPLWKLSREEVVRQIGEPTHALDATGIPVLVYSEGELGNAKPRCAVYF
jgi:hypothetical protein